MNDTSGNVYLVGAGPGDPGLLTLRGRECIALADVIVYDHLANEALLKYSPHGERIFVGKRAGRHMLTQEEINKILVEQARSGRSVVRLKGGDSFIFGRGGEEALALADAGIPFEVVPGVTAGTAAPAYAGIPLTHRGKSAGVVFVTGHREPGHEESMDLRHVPKEYTLVIYMGVKNLASISATLIETGWPAQTPVAVIQWGTHGGQHTVTGTLDAISGIASHAEIEPPAIIVIGEVVSLREKLAWFEHRPLYGLRLAVTRARARSSDFVYTLRENGADVFEFPTLEVEPIAGQDAPPHMDEGDWIIFTSVNAVEIYFESLLHSHRDARSLHAVKICGIGKTTVEALQQRSVLPDCVPELWGATEVAQTMESVGGPLAGRRILLPRADLVQSSLSEELRSRGANVVELSAYRTRPPEHSNDLVERLLAFAPHCVTFTSSASLLNFSQLLGPEALAALKERSVFASIGPSTTRTARRLGIPIAIEPKRHNMDSLVHAIMAWHGRASP